MASITIANMDAGVLEGVEGMLYPEDLVPCFLLSCLDLTSVLKLYEEAPAVYFLYNYFT